MEYNAGQDDWTQSNAGQLLRQNIEYIEARPDRAVRHGWPLPSAAIIGVGCSVGRWVNATEDEYPVIAICREELESPAPIGLAVTVLNLKAISQ
jgi:hypothetical protein